MRPHDNQQPAQTLQRSTTQHHHSGTAKDPMRDPTTQAIDATVRASPPAAVTIYSTILDMPIEKWVAVFTLVYIGLQVFLLVRDRIVTRRRVTDEKP